MRRFKEGYYITAWAAQTCIFILHFPLRWQYFCRVLGNHLKYVLYFAQL